MSKKYAHDDEALIAWKRGELGADEALRRTRKEWESVARHLWRRFGTRMPSWVAFEDVLQVVLMNVPRLVERYVELGPGSSITGFVASQASLRAEKAIHKWRNARRSGSSPGAKGVNPRKEPSNFEMPVDLTARLGLEGEKSWVDSPEFGCPADQEERAASAELFEAVVVSAPDLKVSIALVALRRAEGDAALAAKILWSNPTARLYCALGSERSARVLMRRAVREATKYAA